MGQYLSFKFQLVPRFVLIGIVFFSSFFCQKLWASQDAVVMVDEAIVYADKQMSAPLGYVRKGRKIKIGSIPRNRSQVYPIIVSGRVAYIRSVDVSTVLDVSGNGNLNAERFKKSTSTILHSNYSFSVFNYLSQINLSKTNDKLKDKDPVNWYGFTFKGGGLVASRLDFDIILNGLTAQAKNETFRAVEIGVGLALRAIDAGRFKFKLTGQALAIPFASYAFKEEFRVNSYGYTFGGGPLMSYRLNRHLGLEVYGGFYYTKLMGFSVPQPYNQISPSFVGTRLGAGFNYEF